MREKKYYIFTLKIGVLNALSIAILINAMIITGLLNIHFKIDYFGYINENIALILIAYLGYMIIHELLHAFSYRLYGADKNKITFGAHIEKGILCCLCKQNINRKNILNSLMFPFFYIGIITYIIGFIINSPLLIILSILNISGCVGDIFMFLYFIKLKDIEYTEFDDPVSFAIYTKNDLSKDKPIGIKFIRETNTIERKDLKKLTISKFSIWAFIILIVMSILLLIK